MRKKVYFFVDGFNFYHSLIDASRYYKKQFDKDKCFKWFNLKSFLQSLLRKNYQLEKIYYFSAYFPYKLKNGRYKFYPARKERHEKYITILKDLRIIPRMGKFFINQKPCPIRNEKGNCFLDTLIEKFICPNYKGYFDKAEEKKTDVDIGITMLKEAVLNNYDACCLVSGDTDFVPALKTIKELYSSKEIGIIYPFNKKNKELSNIADFTIKVRLNQLEGHILDNPYITRKNKEIYCPENWLNK